MMERISNSQSKLETRLPERQERVVERRASLRSNERFTYHSTRYRNRKEEKNATTAKNTFGGATVTRHQLGQMTTTYQFLKTKLAKIPHQKYFVDQDRAGKDLEGIKDSRKHTYIEMPECFTYEKTRGEWTIGRIYRVSPGAPERYALRLMILYTKGATSFSDLKTTKDDNGIPTVHDIFVEAAETQGFLSEDAVVIKSLEEMAAYHMPSQLRASFSAILAFSEIGDTQTLWNLFKKDMSEDFLTRGYDQDESEARAYYENFVMQLLPLQLTSLFLRCLLSMVSGGAGKTYTYNVILHMLTAMNKNIQCTAWTVIASTLLKVGRTSASLFKLDFGNDSKTSNHSKGKGLPVLEDLVDDVFGGLRGDILDAAILAPKNIDVDLLNEKAHSKMDGTEMRKCILCTFATGSNKGKETFVPRKNELFIKYTSERLRNLRVQEIL
uniref:ATP-dependent DNA helicase n=1 Tax=Caenorhabditis japonica TaxID=281687 RepID=A0A8R1HYM9_CAEJA